MLQEPPKSKRISNLSIRQLIPNIRPPSNETQTSERGNERVSVKHPRGRAPTLHLRLSGFDISPVIRSLRSPAPSPKSLRGHLIPEKTPTSEGYLDAQYPRHRITPSDVPTSPITPNSPWTTTGPTREVSSSTDRTARLPTPTQDENVHHPTHTRRDTMSSTMSNLQVEVMTLSGSPPDPGFVLPIPPRSWSRRGLNLPLTYTQSAVCDVCSCTANSSGADLRCSPPQELREAEDTPIDQRYHQFAPVTPSVNESDIVLSPLEPPQSRQPSWISESSDTSSVVISTAARLTRANTIAGVTSVVIRHIPGVVSEDEVRAGRQRTVTNEHPLGNPLSAVRVERSGGGTV